MGHLTSNKELLEKARTEVIKALRRAGVKVEKTHVAQGLAVLATIHGGKALDGMVGFIRFAEKEGWPAERTAATLVHDLSNVFDETSLPRTLRYGEIC